MECCSLSLMFNGQEISCSRSCSIAQVLWMLTPHNEDVLLHPLIEINLPGGRQSDSISAAKSPKREATLRFQQEPQSPSK
jgi:hypothetical protein